MKTYILEVSFEEERHCLQCPIRNEDDDCSALILTGMDIPISFSWENQMQYCPLKEKQEG